jgi:type IV pilus assembly protein PilA
MTQLPPGRRCAEAGFTLTELLVVILIVGVLAAIAVPTLMGQRDRGIDAAAKGNAASAASAMAIYGTDHDTYACGDNAACRSAVRAIDPEVPASAVDFSAAGSLSGDPTRVGYRVTARGGSQRLFWVDRDRGDSTRGCDVNGAASAGGCAASGGSPTGKW